MRSYKIDFIVYLFSMCSSINLSNQQKYQIKFIHHCPIIIVIQMSSNKKFTKLNPLAQTPNNKHNITAEIDQKKQHNQRIKNKSNISVNSNNHREMIQNNQSELHHKQKEDKKTPQFQLFQKIYQHKYINSQMISISEKNKTFANKGKPEVQVQPDFGLVKSKSVGSLLPKLKQLQVIAASDKKQTTNNKIKKTSEFNHISPLEIYLNKKQIKKQDQLKLVFITENLLSKQSGHLSDKMLNQQFSDFVFKNRPSQIKNLKAILNLADSQQLTNDQKHTKIEAQKQELKKIFKQIVNIHNNNDLQDHYEDNQVHDNSKLNEQDSESNHPQNKKKDINWVLKQCKKYDRKFMIKKKSHHKIRTNKSVPKLVSVGQSN